MNLLRNGPEGYKAYEGAITEGNISKIKSAVKAEDNPFEGLAIIELSQTWNRDSSSCLALILTRCNRVQA